MLLPSVFPCLEEWSKASLMMHSFMPVTMQVVIVLRCHISKCYYHQIFHSTLKFIKNSTCNHDTDSIRILNKLKWVLRFDITHPHFHERKIIISQTCYWISLLNFHFNICWGSGWLSEDHLTKSAINYFVSPSWQKYQKSLSLVLLVSNLNSFFLSS